MDLNLDITIVLAFLLLNLIAGLGYSSKISTIKEYAIGNRNFTSAALIATTVSTWASGSGFFTTLSKTYTDGFEYLVGSCGIGISLIILALFLVPRMGEFLGKVSIAEAIGELYGKQARIITAVTGSISAAGLIAVQFKVFGNVFAYFLEISAVPAIMIAGTITILYSAFGGIKAVTFTDILQFFAFGMILPLIGFIVWNEFYQEGYTLATAMNHSKFNFEQIITPGSDAFNSTLVMFVYFTITLAFSTASFQRIAMGKSIKQVRNAFLVSGVFLIVIKLLIAWIPFLLNITHPNIPADKLLGFVIDHYSFTGLKGLIIIAIIAFAMSTADSQINSSTVLFTNDIIKTLSVEKLPEITISRVFSILLGALSIWLALVESDLIGIIVMATSFYESMVLTPFLFAVLGFRTTTKPVLIGMASGFITIISWKYGFINKFIYDILPSGLSKVSSDMVGILLSMTVNGIFLFASHYLLNSQGGWIGVKDTKYIMNAKKDRRKLINNLKISIINFKLYAFFEKISPKNSITYTMIGMYLIVSTFSTMYSVNSGTDHNFSMSLYQVMMIFGVIIAMYPIWPITVSEKYKKMAITYIWPIATFFSLIFCSTFFTIESKFSSLQVALFVINLMISAIIFGWKASILLIPVGTIFAIKTHLYIFGSLPSSQSFQSPDIVILYMVFLVASTLLIFLKPQQEYTEATEKKVKHFNEKIQIQQNEIERLGSVAQRILNNVNHELRLPVGNVKNFSEMLSEGLENFNKDHLKMLSDEVLKNSTRLSTMILNMLDLATLNANKIELSKQLINLSELVEDRISGCIKMYLNDKSIDFKIDIESNIMLNVDANYIRQTIDNLIINAINYSNSGTIDVRLFLENSTIKIIIKDEGIGIPKHEIYDIFTPFKMSSKTEIASCGRGIGLALCKAAVEAHGGKIFVDSDGLKGATFTILLQNIN